MCYTVSMRKLECCMAAVRALSRPDGLCLCMLDVQRMRGVRRSASMKATSELLDERVVAVSSPVVRYCDGSMKV